MQRKYNMALQHFYQAATHSTTDDDDMKVKLKDLSGSEEEIFVSEKQNSDYYEMKEINSDTNENSYFTYKKEMSVKRIKPVSICSWRGSTLLCIWFVLFLVGVVSISYCLQVAISRIPNKRYTSNHVYKHRENKTSLPINVNHNYTEPCSDFKVEPLWTITLEKIRTQSAIRFLDVNNDGIDDILYGFSTSIDGPPNLYSYQNPDKAREVCKKFYSDIFPCFGGVVAINGTNGKQLWIHYSMHEVTNLICNADLNNDGYADCLCSGHGGVFEAVNGKTGDLIWRFHDDSKALMLLDFFMPQFVNDLDGDGILDVIQFLGGHLVKDAAINSNLMGKVLFLSGKTGRVLKIHSIANGTDTHSSPVIYLGINDTTMVVYGTGDETHAGHLYVISLNDLFAGRLNRSQKVLSNDKKGYISPPILVDLNGDGTVDIVTAGFGDKIQAVDGITLKIMWTYHSSNTETYSIPAAGYYNKDETVDLFVRVNTGSGFPVYYDSKVLVLDGKTGLPLVDKPYKTSVPAHSSPLSISMEGLGNDLFLYWSVDCVGHEHEGGWYNFVPGTDVLDSIHSDSCVGRFGQKSFMKLYVTNEKIGFPGKPIFFSGDHVREEANDKETLLLQTGAILPSVMGTENHQLASKFDVVFATSDLIAPNVRVITPTEMHCIKKYRERAANDEVVNTVDKEANRAKGLYDAGDTATNICLSERLNGTIFDDNNSAKKENFNNGRLTLYRYQITCACRQGKDCVRVLPKREQGWREYMGSLSNSLFNSRPKGRFRNV